MFRRSDSGIVDKISTFVLANLLWVLLAIPLVTIPAATAGLFAVMTRWARGQPTELFQDFFAGMRKHWRNATLIGIADLLIGGLIVANLSIFRVMNPAQIVVTLSQSATLLVALTVLAVNLYLFPLLVLFDLPLRRLVGTAVRLVFAFPLWSLVLLALAALPILISVLLLPAAFLVLATFAWVALSVSWVVWRVVRRYVTVETNDPVNPPGF